MTTTDVTDVTRQAEETQFDPAKAEAFGGHIMRILSGGLLSLMVDIGYRTGLFAAAARVGHQRAARGQGRPDRALRPRVARRHDRGRRRRLSPGRRNVPAPARACLHAHRTDRGRPARGVDDHHG